MSVDASRLSAALRAQATVLVTLADTLSSEPAAAGTAEIPAPSSAQGTQPAEAPRRGRGRPAKGEGPAPAVPAANTAAGASSTAGAAPSAAAGAPVGAAGTSPSEPDPFDTAPPAAAVPTATLDEVRAALVALKDAKDQATALGVLKSAGGATNLGELKPENYGAVVQAARAAMPGQATEPDDPFGASAAEPEKIPTVEEVRQAIVEAQKRTSADTVQKIVMKHGGKAVGANGVVGPSLKTLPQDAYAACLKEIQALPATK